MATNFPGSRRCDRREELLHHRSGPRTRATPQIGHPVITLDLLSSSLVLQVCIRRQAVLDVAPMLSLESRSGAISPHHTSKLTKFTGKCWTCYPVQPASWSRSCACTQPLSQQCLSLACAMPIVVDSAASWVVVAWCHMGRLRWTVAAGMSGWRHDALAHCPSRALYLPRCRPWSHMDCESWTRLPS